MEIVASTKKLVKAQKEVFGNRPVDKTAWEKAYAQHNLSPSFSSRQKQGHSRNAKPPFKGSCTNVFSVLTMQKDLHSLKPCTIRRIQLEKEGLGQSALEHPSLCVGQRLGGKNSFELSGDHWITDHSVQSMPVGFFS